jgi:hypothetical protein
MKKREKVILLGIGLLVLGSAGMVLFGSVSLESVRISFVGKGKEHGDKFIPGVNSEEKAPDYGVDVRVGDGWTTVGVKNNHFLGGDEIVFAPSEHIPAKAIREIRLYDDDPVEDDILERMDFRKGIMKGKNYEIEARTGFSVSAGWAFYFLSPVGKAILLGITIGVALVVVIHFGGVF